MTTLGVASCEDPGTSVTLSASLDYRERPKLSNDKELLTQARGLLHDAASAGLTEARKRQLINEALEVLRRNGPILDREAVGVLLEIGTTTVTRYIMWSKEGGRYADDPFPAPSDYVGGRSPVWALEVAAKLLEWKNSRPGRGAGGGRPWHKEREHEPKNA